MSRTAFATLRVLLCTLPGIAGAQGLPRAPRPESVGLSSAALARIAPALKAWVDSGRVAGAIAVVARHGKLAYIATAGAMDAGHGRPMSSDAVFRIFSMTKPIVTTAVMQLFEQGKLALDDPVSKYIPAFAEARVYAGGGMAHPSVRNPATPVTIAHLLTHTAGLTYGLFGATPVDSIYTRANIFRPDWTIAQLSDSLAHLPLMFDPGSAWNYSFAIDVLGRVIEVVSRTTLDRYLDSAIFRPLGMTNTTFHATAAMVPHLATVYGRAKDGTLQAGVPLLGPEYSSQGKLLSGGGGLLSTVADYLRFAQMLLNGGRLEGHTVLRKETVALMMQNHLPPHLVPIPAVNDWPPGRNGFGYGGAVRVDSAPPAPGSARTFRWAGYASTFFLIDRKADLISMLWAQFLPATDLPGGDSWYQRLVYAALSGK
jgi:CubicO group peptidase (beta-lactamase class C family)